LMAVAQASSSVLTTRRMAKAVCSLLKVNSRQRQHFTVENIKRQTPKPFKLSDQTLSMMWSLRMHVNRHLIIAELDNFLSLITLAAESS
jgi:hypothetical protein